MIPAPLVFSILAPLENAVTWILDRFHYNLGLPWAWAIVGTTIAVRIALVPLTIRQIHSMQTLQRHAPEMKELQRKYKGDKQKLNEEMMKFYKENHINPAASCLPLRGAVPDLHLALPGAQALRQAHPAGSNLSWLHFVPNITDNADSHWSGFLLLAVYAVSQMSSTYFMSAAMDKTQRTADDGPAAHLHHLHRPVQGRARPLLGNDQSVDGRTGPDHPPPVPRTARPPFPPRPSDRRAPRLGA